MRQTPLLDWQFSATASITRSAWTALSIWICRQPVSGRGNFIVRFHAVQIAGRLVNRYIHGGFIYIGQGDVQPRHGGDCGNIPAHNTSANHMQILNGTVAACGFTYFVGEI